MLRPFKKKDRAAFENFLRAKNEAYTGTTEVASYPYYLIVDPSDACQLRCTTCPTGMENQRRLDGEAHIPYRSRRMSMRPELFDALIDELGPYLFLLMFYNWGEPLLNKWIHQFIRKAHRYDIETELHSNLSLPLSDERIRSVLDSGLDRLVGSIDGFSQKAYEIHRVGGDMELIKDNLERIVAIRDQLGVQTVIKYKMLLFRHNEHEVKAAKRYCADLGIEFSAEDAVINDPSWLPSHRKDEIPFHIKENQKVQAEVIDAINVDSHPYGEDSGVRYPRKNRVGEEELPDFCSWHYGTAVVTGAGPVPSCCATPYETDDMGVFEPGQDNFASLWNNENYRHARSLFSPDGVYAPELETACDRCVYPKVVRHIYSVHDLRVIAAFHQQFTGKDHVLESAYKLLSHLRYGWLLQQLLQRGLFHPLFMLLAGSGQERDMARYIDFCRSYLSDSSAAAS